MEKDYFIPLYDVAKVINASLEPARVLSEIVQCTAAAMEIKACSLRLLDKKKEKLIWAAATGLSTDYIRKGAVVVSESGLDRRALGGETVYIEDASVSSEFQYGEKAESEGIKSVLVTPLMVENKSIGVLRVYSDEVRKFHENEIKFLKAVANLSAIALENARLHQAVQIDYDLLTAHKYRLDDN